MTTLTSQMIQKETRVDPFLSQVYNFITGGWPTVVLDPSFAPFKSKRDELTTQQGCILWSTRLVVPSSLQEKVLQELHDTYPRMSRMKASARSYIWWPNIDSHIEHLPVHEICTSYSSNSSLDFPSTTMVPHVDFAGPISGCMYMVVVDAYSKFPGVVKMANTTA